MSHRVPLDALGPLSACHRQEVNSYWLLNKWLQCVGVRALFPPHFPSLDKHVLTEQLHTNPLGEILHIVPQAADKWKSYSTCKHDLLRMEMQKCICAYTWLNTNADASEEYRGFNDIQCLRLKRLWKDKEEKRMGLQEVCRSASYLVFLSQRRCCVLLTCHTTTNVHGASVPQVSAKSE